MDDTPPPVSPPLGTPPGRTPVCRFGPDRRLTAGSGVLAVVAAGLAVAAQDRPGRLLFLLAALVLLVYTVTDLVFWPRLTVSAAGIELRSPTGMRAFAWPEVSAVRADSRQRLGLRSVTLEVDAADELHVFSKRALGTDPEQVAGIVAAMDPRRRG